MAKYACTRSFQYRGTMVRTGCVLELSDAEAADKFVAAHVEPLERVTAAPAAVGATQPDAGKDTPAKEASEDDLAKLTAGQVKYRLARLGVHYDNNMTREDLLALYVKAREAVAGSPAEPNRPTQDGLPLGTK